MSHGGSQTQPSQAGEAGATPNSGGTASNEGGATPGDGGTSLGGHAGDTPGAGGAVSEAGAGGSALPACGPAAGLTVADGFRVDVFSASVLFVQPNAMVFGNDGKMYVANSHSLLSGASDQGEVLVVDGDGGAALYATDDAMRGPDGVAFLAPSQAGELGTLLVATEDNDEAGLSSTDAILRVDGDKVSSFVDAAEPSSLLRAPGGAFGTDIYFTARENLTGGPPNPIKVFHRNDSGVGGVFKITLSGDAATEIVGANVLTWGTGGTLGQDLYLGAVQDLPFSPGSGDAIYRVTGAGSATLLVSGRSSGLAASPKASGAYGDYLYALVGGSVLRIDAQANTTVVADGLSQPNGIVFGPDGVLYIADTGASRIVTVRPCASE